MSKRLMNTVERLPIQIIRAEGVRLFDEERRAYFDLWGDEGVASLGYTPEFWDSWLAAVAVGIPHRLPDVYPNLIRSMAADAICERAGFDKVFFCNSGTEANEAAIKLARRYWARVRQEPDRYHILTLDGNFHGRTGFAMAASDARDSPYHKEGYGPMPEGFHRWDGSSLVHPAGHEPCFVDSENGMSVPFSKVAAITMAPILGNNVVKTYPEPFWYGIKNALKHSGALLIFDEVQVGMGRVGTFCAHHRLPITFGVRPDILCLGKGIALGLPAAACLADEGIARAFVPGSHFSTFGGSIIVCAALLHLTQWWDAHHNETLEKEEIIRRYFQDFKWCESFDGAGVHWGFVPDWDDLATDGFKFCEKARENGLLLVTHRPYGPIRFCPPLSITPDELTEVFARLAATAHAIRPRD